MTVELDGRFPAGAPPAPSQFPVSVTRPHRTLRGAIEHYFSDGPVPEPSMRTIVPDASVHIVFNLGDGRGVVSGIVEPEACVIGVRTAAFIVEHPARSAAFGASIAIGAASLLLNVPSSSLRDQVVDLRDVWGREAEVLLARLRELPTTAARTRHLEAFFMRKLALPRQPDPRASKAIGFIRTHRGQQSIADLARELGWTERHLQRFFQAEIGLSPKELSRIARIHAVLARIGCSPLARLSWVTLACEFGFADQAHLVREFRALTGVSPARYVSDRGMPFLFNTALAEDSRSRAEIAQDFP